MNNINQQMTALANAVRNKANIQSKLTIANMINVLSGLNLSADITLGEIDQNGNFQPLSFSETSAFINGQSIPISNYYTWNNISSTPTPTIEEETGADITASYMVSGNYDPLQKRFGTIILNPIEVSGLQNNYNGIIWNYSNNDGYYSLRYYPFKNEFFYALWGDDGTKEFNKIDGKPENIIGTYQCNNDIITVTKVTE